MSQAGAKNGGLRQRFAAALGRGGQDPIPVLARPGVGQFETFKADHAGTVLGYREGSGPGRGQAALTEFLRGTEDWVRYLQEPYVALVAEHQPVLDLGCGRGEFLDLLRAAGMEHSGVDSDPEMVARCRAKGHRAVAVGDAVAHLTENVLDHSLGTVFSAQVIEHLPYADLVRLLEVSMEKLRSGGIFVAETVNPYMRHSMDGFWIDPTHQHPLFPETMLALCDVAGFEPAYVFCARGSGDFERDRTVEPTYAVIATRPDGEPA
jgi:SAM-dependent methyltransferase